MTSIDRRSCPFVGAGDKCGQENGRREVELIIVMNNLFTIDVLKRSVALMCP